MSENLLEDYYNLKRYADKLQRGYCELKEKCNKGDCDCTHEEYNEMCEQNIKMDLEIERLNNIINESAEEILKELEENHHLSYGVALAIRQKLLDYKELKGSDKE